MKYKEMLSMRTCECSDGLECHTRQTYVKGFDAALEIVCAELEVRSYAKITPDYRQLIKAIKTMGDHDKWDFVNEHAEWGKRAIPPG